MSIYNFTVLKSNPLKACIPLENGLAPETELYRIKWHGSDGSLDNYNAYFGRLPFQQAGDWFFFDVIRRRAEYHWKGEKPAYMVSTGPLDTGKIDWNDPDVKEKGLDVYECVAVAWQEDSGTQRYIGKLFKRGRGKYEFIPKAQDENDRISK